MSVAFDSQSKLGYLETTGRVSGQLRETEIWFALEDNHLYILSGGGLAKDWVRNAQQQPQVRFRIGETWLSGRYRLVTEAAEDLRARQLLGSKYYGIDPNDPNPGATNDWLRSSIPVVIDLSHA